MAIAAVCEAAPTIRLARVPDLGYFGRMRKGLAIALARLCGVALVVGAGEPGRHDRRRRMMRACGRTPGPPRTTTEHGYFSNSAGCDYILAPPGGPLAPSCTFLGNDVSGAWTSQVPRGEWVITDRHASAPAPGRPDGVHGDPRDALPGRRRGPHLLPRARWRARCSHPRPTAINTDAGEPPGEEHRRRDQRRADRDGRLPGHQPAHARQLGAGAHPRRGHERQHVVHRPGDPRTARSASPTGRSAATSCW